VRLEVSSSDFPQFDPNPNTGATLAASTAMAKATQTVFYGPEHPSALILPLIPADDRGSDRPPAR
jgi:predicted acyl esterase